MPVEIKELVVKTTVGDSQKTGSVKNNGDLRNDPEKFKEEIISECREMFIELLKEQSER